MQLKKVIKFSMGVMVFCVSAAQAGQTGLYVGGQAGMTKMHNQTRPANVVLQDGSVVSTTATPKNNNSYGGRIFAGYQISNYAAVEGGFNYFTTTDYKTDVTNTCSSPSVGVKAIDLVGKGIIPLQNQFELYAKAGAAYAMVKTSGSLKTNSNTACGGSKNENSVRPIVGVGATYYFNPNWSADISATRIMSGSNMKNADLFALGFAYHFVDHYCGQFLCDGSDK